MLGQRHVLQVTRQCGLEWELLASNAQLYLGLYSPPRYDLEVAMQVVPNPEAAPGCRRC